MKIEKINDNQIRCTLTREDLESHQIRISELAYGTDKAKKLFRDMMQQAQIQFGFEADNIPLMIEAVPLTADSILLIVTKVEYPEELDTRFSHFSENMDPDDFDMDSYDDAMPHPPTAADDILKLNERRELTITFHYPEEGGNSGQAQYLSFDLKADAVQTKNNPQRLFD